MRTNINLIPNNFFVRNKNKVYIDYTENIFIKKFGNDCKDLELIYQNQSNTWTNYNLKNINLTEDEDIIIEGLIFGSESKFIGLPKITPSYLVNYGSWKTKNNNYICDDINSFIVDYPIKTISPNIIIINGKEYKVKFNINCPIFSEQEEFKVILISNNHNIKRTYKLGNLIYSKNKQVYEINFSSSIFLNPRIKFINANYYIVLQSVKNYNIFLSNPNRYIHINDNLELENLKFSIINNYNAKINSDVLIKYKIDGLLENSNYIIKIMDLNEKMPIYYSPVKKYDSKENHQKIKIGNINIHSYNVELEYNGMTIMDLENEINVDYNYNVCVHIINYDDYYNVEEKKINLILYFDKKLINQVVNISLDNIFIKNDIITNNNYYCYKLEFDINEIFNENEYHIKIQLANNNKYYGISNETIKINKKRYDIFPNIGYYKVPFSENKIYNSFTIKNEDLFCIPDGVYGIKFNIIYNNNEIGGIIKVRPKSIINLKCDTNGIIKVNDKEILNINKNKYLKSVIKNFEIKMNEYNADTINKIDIDYLVENSYIIKMYNYTDQFLNLYVANNKHGINRKFLGTYKVYNDGIYGNHIRLNDNSFETKGNVYYYIEEECIGCIKIEEYEISSTFNIINSINKVYQKELVKGKLRIKKNKKINEFIGNNFDIYFVDDIYGNNPIYLTTIKLNEEKINDNKYNLLDISFIYVNDDFNDKYIKIESKLNNYIISEIIEEPIKIEKREIKIDELENLSKITKLSSRVEPLLDREIIGVYTTFDNPPNKITPSYFLERYGLYTYKNVSSFGESYSNYDGYLILQTDPLSNSIAQNLQTLDTFINSLLSELANKRINLINVPLIFKDSYIGNGFQSEGHTFEYYANTIFNNKLINVQNSLCLRIVQNNQIITDIPTIKNNFLLSYNDEVRNYEGQNKVNNEINTVSNMTSENPRFAWIEDLGKYICQYYDLSINNVLIEKLTSDFINIASELGTTVGKKEGYYKMIGNVPELTKFSGSNLPKYKLNIPLPFYFNRYNAGLSLPIISLLHSDIRLTMQINKLEDLIISDPLTKFISSGKPKMKLYLKYIYLDSEERKTFATMKHEYLIEQENYRNYTHYGTKFSTKMNLMNPVKDIFWFAQPKQNVVNKQYFNYTTSKYYRLLSNYDRYDEDNPITELSRQKYRYLYEKYPNVKYIPLTTNNVINDKHKPYPTKSPINRSILKLNGQERFNEDSDLTTKINFDKYMNMPIGGLHVYNFSRYPNEYQPSGSCNFSMLGDAYFNLETDDGAYDVKLIARGYNLLRIMGGQAGLAFEL